MSMNAEAVERFLKEVTKELLYNIVFNQKFIKPKDLRDKFQKKTGYRPMQFFGFGNENGLRLVDLMKEIPGLKPSNNKIYMCDDSEDDSDDDSDDGSDDGSNKDSDDDSDDNSDDDYKTKCIFKLFNTTFLKEKEEDSSLVSVATYREMLLIKCCEMISNEFSDLTDKNGNTPLHIIAALPGVTYNCSTLVKYLLQAGVDPLETNKNGQTLLHILFGRFHALEKDNGALMWLNNERMTETEWFVEDQYAVLNLLYEELSSAHRALLAKAQDNNGNTVLHEYALATTIQQEFIQERKIAKKLLGFGASLTIPNNSGEVPLHHAFNPSVFQIFLQKGAFLRARNYRDETPVLFILKKAVDLAFSETSASEDLADQGFVEMSSFGKSVSKALKLLENLKSIVSNHEDVRETVWIPDIKGNIAMDIVLLAIRIASYDLNCISRRKANKMRLSLVKLLRAMIRKASPKDMKRQNGKGQSFLHVLLDMGDGNEYEIIEDAEIVKSVEILLNHDVVVNTVDVNGQTPLDITYKCRENGPTVYDKCVTMITEYMLAQGVSNLHIQDETRKLRKCPKRHWDSAQSLTDPNSQVVVVGKYRYSNEDAIGSGAFSTVFVAIKDENVDSRSGTIQCRAYALKRLDKAKINRQEIKREINTLLSVSDENIIKCHESFEQDFFQYLCLDLMDGDVHAFVANREVNSVLKKDPTRAVQVMQDIINGLKYLHNHGFIHRDLKPGNILYTTDPDLLFKIGDFGLTKNISNITTMTSTENDVGMVPGTRCWMAPELVSRVSREHTKESDLFSLGLVLYYLFTFGKHPFVAEMDEAPDIIESRIKKMQTCFDRKLHPEAASFFQTLLSENPKKRPPAAYLYQHPFLWSERKKIEFLKAVGDQPEAESPSRFPNSQLERCLQKTTIGKSLNRLSWDWKFEDLYEEIRTAWTGKKYRTDKVIDLLRFIRNAYAHRQNRTLEIQEDLRKNIFRQEYPSLVLDVFDVVQKLDFHVAKDRKNIREALNTT